MKQHQYHVSVQHLADAKGQPSNYCENIEFNVGNHDDIFEIVERLKKAEFFDDETTKAFAVGLKLFLEVMITHRDHILFKDFEPAVKQFMKNLKQNVKKEA
ncbi:DUF3861 domain-containing protein [Acinetobacter bereziniae]|jgi:hypothetical protein|uniref:DUF3861 domain-containing protein n=1 Tax=Acinetobacter bereziniae TaxID=106648 RepID=UPI00124C38E1|nr:DUF3861 domain-containing protein [Acinetobacter bereziniae]MBJ8451507.1 DUF3861 domain-containing protein [Acinetobacter bereziniae]MBJ8455660.1 DUF3861 domain-containing protein [Acinetobacter bereziniae]MDQ9817749.1 DUF3861 domain-containing protein [Acinetobacter bereziniae]MDV8156948.1 DUF3861 domain-containing protein [Acinetobacter bereziniae]